MKRFSIWPVLGVLTITCHSEKNIQTTAKQGPNTPIRTQCPTQPCKRPLYTAWGLRKAQEPKKAVALIALTELLWFRCWLKCCQMTWGFSWGTSAALQLLLYANALRGDTADCGISAEVFSTGHCFHLNRVSWQSRQPQTSDLPFRDH